MWEKLIRSPLTSFLTQLYLSLGSGLFFVRTRQDMILGWFIQTASFVIFNKVCTSQVWSSLHILDRARILISPRFQYFLWYLLFLPLLIPHLSLSRSSFIKYLTCWIGTQALWLSQAYNVEFLGEPIFCRLWLCSLIYVIGHSWVLAGITDSYRVWVQ
jgi:phosphatidylinositol glycan class M